MGQVGRLLLLGALCAPLTGCWQALGGAFAVVGGLATVADSARHWNDECRIPPGKQAVEAAGKALERVTP